MTAVVLCHPTMADMHVIAAEQTADGVDWMTTRIHMRLTL